MLWEDVLCKEILETGQLLKDFSSEYNFLVSSSFFRRLQDKAQVFPLENGDFSRTRLTHSIEAMSTAEALGNKVKDKLINQVVSQFDSNDKTNENINYLMKQINLFNRIPTILKTAAAIHDLGNPPFGHIAEEIISKWFKDNLKYFYVKNNVESVIFYKEKKIKGYKQITQILSTEQKTDLLNFEGNAQLLRIMSKLMKVNNNGGYSYALYSACRKYTVNSSQVDKKASIEKHKVGFFQSEKNLIDKLEKKILNIGKRTPLAFLLEASDDISYLTADIEDAMKKNILTIKEVSDAIKHIAKTKDFDKKHLPFYSEINNFIEDTPSDSNASNYRLRDYFRSKMLDAVCDTFIKNEEQILNGTYEKELLSDSKANYLSSKLKKLLENKVYQCRELALQKSKVFEILDTLLTNIVPASFSCCKTNSKKTDKKNDLVCQLLSENYRELAKKEILAIKSNAKLSKEEKLADSIYCCFMLAIDEISGMTDFYAVQMYNTFKAIN